jgi:phosphatidylglycerophosphatase A
MSDTGRRVSATTLWRHPVHLAAFGFGAGLAPVAPGTWGTLIALPFYALMVWLSPVVYALTLLALFAAGVWLCGRTAQDLGVHDHAGIVWDEIVGYLVTMFMAPAGWVWVVMGFALFRLFDVWKPFPISWLDQRIRGGLGIMLDDVAAGIAAALSLQAIYWLWMQNS